MSSQSEVVTVRNNLLFVALMVSVSMVGCQSAAPKGSTVVVGGSFEPEDKPVSPALIERCKVLATRASDAHKEAKVTLD